MKRWMIGSVVLTLGVLVAFAGAGIVLGPILQRTGAQLAPSTTMVFEQMVTASTANGVYPVTSTAGLLTNATQEIACNPQFVPNSGGGVSWAPYISGTQAYLQIVSSTGNGAWRCVVLQHPY